MFEMHDSIKASFYEEPHEYARIIVLNPEYLAYVPLDMMLKTLAYFRSYLIIEEDKRAKIAYANYVENRQIDEYAYADLLKFIRGFMKYFKIFREENIEIKDESVMRLLNSIGKNMLDQPVVDEFGDSVLDIHLMRMLFFERPQINILDDTVELREHQLKAV